MKKFGSKISRKKIQSSLQGTSFYGNSLRGFGHFDFRFNICFQHQKQRIAAHWSFPRHSRMPRLCLFIKKG